MRLEKALFIAAFVFCLVGWLWPHVKQVRHKRTYPRSELWTQRMYQQADLTLSVGKILAVLSFVALFLDW